ncbi:MAG: hypothetical protein R2724_07285 [Bryobacterales bacterium]
MAYVELLSNYGHDAFLVEAGEQTDIIRGFSTDVQAAQAHFKAESERSTGFRWRSTAPTL